MKTVSVRIEGVSPLLMHAYPMTPIEGIEKKPPMEQAEISLYRLPDGTPYVPGLCLQRALVGAGNFSKGKGRASLSKIVAACVFVTPDMLILSERDWQLDSRRVVVPATKGAVIRYRPRFDKWRLDFDLTYEETLLSEVQLRRIVDDAGTRVGLLDFRPEKKGPFGRFMVTSWKSK